MYHIVCDDYSNEIYNTPATKTSVKWLEVPIQKFNCAVSHFVELLKTHDANITKLKKIQQWEELQKELANALKTVNQLTYLLNDMDNLRNQVVDSEISKFDKLVFNSKQSALNAIKIHQDIRIRSRLPTSTRVEDEPSSEEQDQKLQIISNLSEDIKQKEKLAVSMDQLHQDVEDIQSLFQDFAQLVHEQGENVEKIEEHVETTHQNVVEGEKFLCQAAKYKTGIYPLMGAVVGSMVGGPVGLLAGMKLGSLTAVGFGVLGFTGGKLLKSQNEVIIKEAERHRDELAN
uniref:t-SNARE coiled-coil homology domain-containing protein n=1 Tax=Cuerna arida TaxID=1464854 RepID=A0A1B6F7S7_9HEMI